MDIFRLMVYAQQIEDSKIREMIRYGKRSRSDESSQPKSKKRLYNHGSSLGNKDRHSNQNSQEGGYAYERPRCTSSGKKHLGRCLAGKECCFGCGNRGHKIRDCPNLKAKGKEVNQAPHGGTDPNAPMRNHFYALEAKEVANP
ncbi:uncharacterized protein LOC107027518 [Solanum pennellii]|uniref:Uncharacterized protein LOC107027518 n=1 Tax=Solanum pennellii TaxID=28526 RepID=A0ABM1HE27_SOLPN|nr:uncharacterized protein LOC107027518 [Solanum pennellii]